jgi:hypothetical protein
MNGNQMNADEKNVDKFYSNNAIDEETKRNAAFQTVNALREAVSLAKKDPQPITYENTLQYIRDLSPESYQQIVSLLQHKNESAEVKYFKELAEVMTTESQIITPTDLIEQEIQKLNNLIAVAEHSTNLRNKRGSLIAAREYFNPREISEHKLLNHDYYLASRSDVKHEIYTNESYRDYKIDEGNFLRLRLLHPDKAESILGSDLVYEQFDILTHRVRFVHLQYKSWDTRVLYLNNKRLQEQITKMDGHICKSGYCHGSHGKNYTKKFRFPYCSAFLRPTTNKESSESKMKTTGQHLPICEAIKFGKEKITKENIKDKSVSHKIFEEQFVGNMIGSRWIHMDDLDKFYAKTGLNYLSDTIRVHAQEFIIPSEEEIEKRKGRAKKK